MAYGMSHVRTWQIVSHDSPRTVPGASRYLSCLDAHEFTDFVKLFDKNHHDTDTMSDRFTWSSACSGTDSPSWCFKALLLAMQGRLQEEGGSEHSLSLHCYHTISAELNERKRGWILRKTEAEQVFANMAHLSASGAFNWRTQQMEAPRLGRRLRVPPRRMRSGARAGPCGTAAAGSDDRSVARQGGRGR